MNKYFPILKSWFGYAAVITLMCFLVYIIAQQNFRMNANDPQYQMAEDAVTSLDKGTDPKSLSGTSAQLDISTSLSPYLIIYDMAGNRVAGEATLDGSLLKIPKVAIDYVQKNGSDAVTWQPLPGVRQAMVGLRAKGYLAFTGRSLRKVEERIAMLGQQVLFGWIASLVAMLIIVILQEVMTRKTSAA